MLTLKSITKDYLAGDNTVKALKGVSIAFRDNEFVSVLGASGCGKTTLLNIIGGLDKYTSGDLLIRGVSTNYFSDSDWDAYRNNAIGFVFQTYNLIPHLDVLSNVEMALTLAGVSSGERKKRAIEVLEKVGLGDQIHKKPNQLSGGQMQRVAIARALINDPEIILADEPTGALDSETSVQIMDLLKEVAREKLVIMVTHNPDLAKAYSTRIITLSDGLVIDDTNPYENTVEVVPEEISGKKKISEKQKKALNFRRTSMSFLTALKLSLNNLFTKKTRTILTAFAGSIGIIGIALVLAISSGLTTFINKMQTDTLAEFPLQITTTGFDLTGMMKDYAEKEKLELKDDDKVYVNNITEQMTSIMRENKLTQDYVDNVIGGIDDSLYSDIDVTYKVNLNLFKKSDTVSTPFGEITPYYEINSSVSMTNMTSMTDITLWQEIDETEEEILQNYTLEYGELPKNANELILVLDSYNRISDIELKALGLVDESAMESFDMSSVIGNSYYVIYNDELYSKTENGYKSNIQSQKIGEMNINLFNDVNDANKDKIEELKIVGIVRRNSNLSTSTGCVLYTKALREKIMEKANASQIVIDQKNSPDKDLLSNEEFGGQNSATSLENRLYSLGSTDNVYEITIYPMDFDSKEEIKAYLDAYNDSLENEDEHVKYTDIIATVVGTLNIFIDAISYVLIAFTSISLVVSSIMIGIITYVSVIERTKEIGVLRALGARKKDIARVFNAETLIIGFTAGLLGGLVTLLLSVPINLILQALVGPTIGNIANLEFLPAVILVAISMFLTFISGLVPSRIAAKKDPVIALRTE
ncbi:MAG: ABC transporter ATP-binding protein/permease [Clostridia bacterium]|nr:ABC transporter ATP-binding protein/permease [Clostridia bacterium]